MKTDASRTVWLAVLALCLVQFVDVLGVTVVVTALPAMLAGLRAPADAASLISAGYAMFFGGLLMLGARLGDRFGHRRTILAGLVVFAGAAVVGATAASAARAHRGAVPAGGRGGAVGSLGAAAADHDHLRRAAAPDQAIAAWSAAGAAAGASGFVVGGVVTDLVGWRAVFWAYLPLAAALAAAIGRAAPPDGRGPGGPAEPGRVGDLHRGGDGLRGRDDAAAPAGPGGAGGLLLGACLVLAGLFVVLDRRAAAPLLPRAADGARRLRQGAVGGLLNTAATSSALTLATLYLQNARGHSPLAAGLRLLPFSLAVIAGSALAAPALARWPAAASGRRRTGAHRDRGRRADPGGRRAWAVPLCAAVGGAGIGLSSVAATGLGTNVGSRARHRLRDHQHRRPARYRPRGRHAAAGRRADQRDARTGTAGSRRRLGPGRRDQPGWRGAFRLARPRTPGRRARE